MGPAYETEYKAHRHFTQGNPLNHIALDKIFPIGYIPYMACDIEYTDEFEEWWITLTEGEQIDFDAVITLLEIKGPQLGFPYSSALRPPNTAI